MLLALITSYRVQTLSKILIKNIIFSTDVIQIKIPKRIKTSRVNRLQSCLVIPFFEDNPELCVALVLQAYIERTSQSKGAIEELFITCKKPFRPATTQTLARWLKTMLNQSGVDVSIFKVHSTRHASSSAACREGINVDTICQTAGWSKKSEAFARFYKRPLYDKTNCAKAIIKNDTKSK